MAWGKVDDGFYDHDKVLEIPAEMRNEACGLYWRAISYCNAKLTDGAITERTVHYLDGRQEIADQLLRVGLWNRRTSGSGYVVHDFADHNRTRRQVEQYLTQKVEAGRAGGIKSGEARRKQNGSESEADAKHPASVRLNYDRESDSDSDSHPNPSRKREGRRGRRPASGRSYDDLVRSDADISFEEPKA